jgi:uncharacterized Zn-binding protein involved in type VI secretion
MSIPASRFTDSIDCPTHGSKGPVVGPCGPEVYVGELPIARVGDLCDCGRPHASPLAEGAGTVFIHSLPAARIGAKTIDGGALVTGESSVLIGGAAFSLPFITIEGDAEYQAKVLRDLGRMASTKDGQKLFASMAEAAKNGRKVRICQKDGAARTLTDPQLKDPRYPPGGGVTYNDPRSTDRTGTDAKIEYDPDAWNKDYPKEMVPPDKTRDATLFHEMTHANDMMHGTADEGLCPNPGGDSFTNPCRCGERRAVGLPPYDDREKYPFSENGYRQQRGYKTRTYY